VLPQIDAALVKEGHSIPRPQYEGIAPVAEGQDADEESAREKEAGDILEEAEEEAEEEMPVAKPKKPAKKELKPKKEVSADTEAANPAKSVEKVKKNYEATDDEEDELPAAESAASKLAKFMHS